MTDNQTTDHLQKNLAELAVEAWRFGRAMGRSIPKLGPDEQRRAESQQKWFFKRTEEILAEAGLKLVNLEGQPFEVGLAATPLNIDDFAPEDPLIIDLMLEPVIMGPAGLLKAGSVLLKKAEK